jgi:hypothetical protein
LISEPNITAPAVQKAALPAGAIRAMAQALVKQPAVLDKPATGAKAAAR